MPNDNANIPLYVHIESILRQKILTGQLAHGEQLPTIRELSRHFRVSHITIRTALDNLKAERLLSAQRGKGVYVADHVPLPKPMVFTGDVQGFVEDWEKHKAKVLGMEKRRIRETRIPRDLETFFGMGPQEPVYVIRRVRFLDDNPIYLSENFLRPEIGKHLTMGDLSKRALQRILRDRMGLQIGENETYLQSVLAEPDVAESLDSDVFAPVLLLQARIWLATGEPLEIVNIFMKSDSCKYKIRVRGPSIETRGPSAPKAIVEKREKRPGGRQTKVRF
ncbi:MAG: GntR family transcriptional regulator [Acidobacteriota bacterium]